MLEEDRPEVERLFAESDWPDGLVVLPERRLEDGSGVYEKGLIDLVKDLRVDGVQVSWADEPGQRAFVEKRSAAEVIWGAVVGIPSGLISTAIWAALAKWFGQSPQRAGQMRVEIVREIVLPDGTTKREWLYYEGAGAAVGEAIEADVPKPLPSESSVE